ncbi:hypothetical protein SUGI_0488600 [Cryptomeria japonica]|nr:hypothetical protein SUGI_0488600 [Cryptomeria japonica]
MENQQYAEELIREFLVFRGFTNTLRTFEAELSTDIGRGFQVDKILDLIFSVYVPKFEADKLVSLLNFLKQCFFSPTDARFNETLAKLELATMRYYVVYALQKGRHDKVVECFGRHGNDFLQTADDWCPWFDLDGETWSEEDFSEVTVEFQETFSGHTSPITRCRFSAAGTNIASASVDGTVRIWTYDSSTPTSRNATIYCGAEIMSLDWEYKSDRLLLIGTAQGGIKAWNVDAKRVVCDLSTTAAFPNVLDLKCSPVEPIFVSAAASRGHGSKGIEQMGFASLTAWNMKTWKPLTVLPLGEDPPAITSVCFNHNGKILAASATDGMIHMFDMSAGLPITGWPAHDSAVCSVKFGPDEASILSLGADGKIFEWSLHNQGQVLWSHDSGRHFGFEIAKLPRHEMAMDAHGRRLLVTSNSLRSPLYQIQGKSKGQKTLQHGAPITSVDWHPSSPIFLTGSADHSVRVTSIS